MVSIIRLLLMFAAPHYASSSEEYVLAYMTSSSGSLLGYLTNGGAPHLALEDAEDAGLIGKNSIRILPNFRGCVRNFSSGEAVNMIVLERVSGFIGAGCSSATMMTGYFASYFNVPVMPQAAVDPRLSDKGTYDTLLRVLPSYDKLGLAIIEVITYYGWRKVLLVSRSKGLCNLAASGLHSRMSRQGVTVIDWLQYETLTDHLIDSFLSAIKLKARILYICMNTSEKLRFMNMAQKKNMTSSEYVYITNSYRPLDQIYEPWKSAEGQEAAGIKSAFRHTYEIVLSDIMNVVNFKRRQKERMRLPPFNISEPLETSDYASTLYDSVYLFALTLNHTLEEGRDPRDGRAFIRTARQLMFRGISGILAFDEQADRQPVYTIHAILEGDDNSTPWGVIDLTLPEGQRFRETRNILDTDDDLPPKDSPPCGFFGEFCLPPQLGLSKPVLVTGITVSCLVLVFIIVSTFYYRRYRKNIEIKLMKWKIAYSDLDLMTQTKGAKGMMSSTQRLRASAVSLAQSVGSHDSHIHQLFTKIALYKGQLVAVKDMVKARPSISKADIIEIKIIRDLSHENVNTLLGACVDGPKICQVTLYCSRGSLQDILETDQIVIDKSFKLSFITDIAKGLDYIHKSTLKSVGNMKSSNCVLDSRWTLKITDIPIGCLKPVPNAEAGEHQIYCAKLWTAPELLRQPCPSVRGTPAGDVYSFSIIIQETLYRSLPYFMEDLTPIDIVTKLIASETPPYRPKCPANPDVHPDILTFLYRCWDEVPANRPLVSTILKTIPYFFDEEASNLVDRIIKKLESYAVNLESIVSERTVELMKEKKKSDNLLAQMLPVSVVEKLKRGQPVDSEIFDEVTVYFSDIMNFDSIATSLVPLQVVNLLNDLYAMIDNIVAKHDAYKVETIGDSYVVASGLPVRNGHNHVAAVADMSLAILSGSLDFTVPGKMDSRIHLRIGMHTGTCCAGVVGRSMPRYCIFGDTVNTASRMESNGQGSRIHISQNAHTALCRYPGYRTSKRGELFVKGKGMMDTFWLLGKAGYTAPLPVECTVGVTD